MKKTCLIWMVVSLLLTLLPTAALADSEEEPISEATAGGVTLRIDNKHRYKGMEKAYKKGYVPTIKGGKAMIVLPLVASNKLKGNSITAIPQLGDPAASPFVFKNYQITVKQKNNPVNDGTITVSSYLVSYELSLVPDRINGVYQVAIDVKGVTVDGGEVMQSFTSYVTITDGKKPVGDAPPTPENPVPQPKVIVEDYQINPSPVIAGKEFTAKVTLKNTNEKKGVKNMTVDVSCDSVNLSLLNNSNTIFVGKLAKGATTEIVLQYKTDLETPAQKYNIALAISYDGADATPLQSSGVVFVSVNQAMNVKMELPQIATQVNAGDTMPLIMQVMNLGRSQVYNVRIELSAPGLTPSGTAFVGNMDAGTASEGKMDVFVGTKDMGEGYEDNEKYGLTSGTLTLIYEDANGKEYRDGLDISTTIHEPVINMANTESEEVPEMASQWWVSIAIGAVLIGILATFLMVRRKNKGKEYETA